MQKKDEIFIIREKELRPLPSRQMREGLFGKSLEDALQTLLSRYPQLLSGSQMSPESDDPPRFFLLRREMPVGSWSLDHLYVDQHAVLTLVETKLMQNPESRREVIGQIVEYAANASDRWGKGQARHFAAEYHAKEGNNLDEQLEVFFGSSFDQDDFWEQVDHNLQTGNIRLVIASDKLRPEVIKMIEYLNGEMNNADVLGLELRCYGSGDEEYVLAPRVVGQSVTVAERKSGSKQRTKWSELLLRQWIGSETNDTTRVRYERLLNLAVDNNVFAESTALNPAFGIFGQTGKRTIWVEQSGNVYFVLKKGMYPELEGDRDYVFKNLKDAGLLDENMEVESIVDGRSVKSTIREMTDNQFESLFNLIQQSVT